jgi:hypothetical protein
MTTVRIVFAVHRQPRTRFARVIAHVVGDLAHIPPSSAAFPDLGVRQGDGERPVKPFSLSGVLGEDRKRSSGALVCGLDRSGVQAAAFAG